MKRLSIRLSSLVVPVLLAGGSVAIACGGTADSSVVGSGDPKTDGGAGSNSGSDGGSSGGDTDGASGGDTDGGSGGGADSGGSSGGAPTWTTIYGTYFASGTPGHCGNSGCHSSTLKGFKCGADKTTCYNGLVTAGYVTTATPTKSPIADLNQSCLTWFGGNMPPGGGSSSAAQKDITAWVADGAKNN